MGDSYRYRITVAGGIPLATNASLVDAARIINAQRTAVYLRPLWKSEIFGKSARVDPRDGTITYAVHGTELDERGVLMYGAWAEPLRRALAITNPRFERTEQGDPDGTDQDQGGTQAVA